MTQPAACPTCGYENPPNQSQCVRCNSSLAARAADSGASALRLFAPAIGILVFVVGGVIFYRRFDGFNADVRSSGLLVIAALIVLPVVAFLVMGARGLDMFRRPDDRD